MSAIKSPPRTSTYSTGGGTSTKNHVPFSAEEVSGMKRKRFIQLLAYIRMYSHGPSTCVYQFKSSFMLAGLGRFFVLGRNKVESQFYARQNRANKWLKKEEERTQIIYQN